MWKKIAAILSAVLVIAVVFIGVGGVLFLNNAQAQASPEAEAALASGDGVTVEQDDWITFAPETPAASTGFIFYPGGLVDPVAYAPPVREIAEAGYLSVIVPMPFGLAVLGADRASGVIDAFPEIDRWVLGGHSLGGAMSAQYADGNPDRLDGIAMWGAYPAEGNDLSGTDLLGLSVYASEDGLSTVEEIEETAAQMPPDTEFVLIDGGNHAGFGLYGDQDGDGEATIPAGEQQALTAAATIELLEAVSAE
jgi:hypothetical protein